ncbi:MAG: hypothetical protein JG777_2680 [Clostridia bacterium]|jgi:Na+/serine symporter|nr:hypothetical protein [Clostridia bacterium]
MHMKKIFDICPIIVWLLIIIVTAVILPKFSLDSKISPIIFIYIIAITAFQTIAALILLHIFKKR